MKNLLIKILPPIFFIISMLSVVVLFTVNLSYSEIFILITINGAGPYLWNKFIK